MFLVISALRNPDTGRATALTVIEPVPKVVEPVLNKVFRSAKVEPWVDYWAAGIVSLRA